MRWLYEKCFGKTRTTESDLTAPLHTNDEKSNDNVIFRRPTGPNTTSIPEVDPDLRKTSINSESTDASEINESKNSFMPCSWRLPKLSIENQKLSLQLAVNFIRDVTWATVTQEAWDIGLHDTKQTDAQLKSQQLWGTVAMLGGVAVFCLVVKCKSKLSSNKSTTLSDTARLDDRNYSINSADAIDIEAAASTVENPQLSASEVMYCGIIYTNAAACAITPWNFAQSVSIDLAKDCGLNEMPAWFLASIATGCIEGFIQYIIIQIQMKFKKDGIPLSSSELKSILNELITNIKLILIELLYNVTIGALPGAIWNVMYVFCTAPYSNNNDDEQMRLSSYQTGLLVGSSVALANFAVTKIGEKMITTPEHPRTIRFIS